MPNKISFDILLVDDDPTVIRILSLMLSEYAPIRFATSGITALTLARQSVPDLVLLDVDLPDLSGFDVCKTFKTDAALTNVPIIFITSHESRQLEAKGIELGAADFIQKPPHAALVQARVRTYQQLKTLSDTLCRGVTMDFLTGAATKRVLEKRLAQEWLRAQRSAAPIALVLADIADFAAYNTNYGEEQGDACLRDVAEALRSVLRHPTDLLGRYSGGQFAILLPDTDAEGARTVGIRAASAVSALQLPGITANVSKTVHLSIGIGYHEMSVKTAAPARLRSGSAAPRVFAPDDLIMVARKALQRAQADNKQVPVLAALTDRAPSRTLSAHR